MLVFNGALQMFRFTFYFTFYAEWVWSKRVVIKGAMPLPSSQCMLESVGVAHDRPVWTLSEAMHFLIVQATGTGEEDTWFLLTTVSYTVSVP